MNAHAERLRGIVDALEVQNLFPSSIKHISNAALEIERLQVQVEELRKDVGVLRKDEIRLDWLQDSHLWPDFWMNLAGALDIREAIDKAMEQTK